jgi:dihydroorotase-like cyclic amidohydrolase
VSGPRTAVVGGTVATDYGVFAADILIADRRIAAVGRDPEIARGADEVIDALGLVVLPGAIDPHAHFEDPGHTEREDFTTGTSAAAAGGITAVIEHPLTYPPVTTAELYRQKRDMAARKVVCDFGLWGAVRAGAARDGGAVAGRGVRVQGLHAVLGAGLPARDRRRVRPGDAKREGARGARARACRV